jgi:hypothetical protein
VLSWCWRGCVQGSGSISKYRKHYYILNCSYIIWHILDTTNFCDEKKKHKKCPTFSVFCVFLNKEWSAWHHFYISVKLSKRGTILVNRAKWEAVLLVPWENLTIKRKRVRKSGKIAKKWEKNKNDICGCHDIKGAVFRVHC